MEKNKSHQLIDIWVVSAFFDSDKIARNIHVHILVWIFALFLFCFPLGYIPRNAQHSLYGNSMFKLLGKYQTIFQTGWNILHSNSSMWGFQDLHILAKNCYYLFLKQSFQWGMKWHLIVFSICISLMPNNFEHFFMFMLICIYWKKSLFNRFFAHLKKKTCC